MFLGISNIRQRFLIPDFFIAGVIARQIAPLPLDGSATTKLATNGSNPLSTASTEAKHVNLYYFELRINIIH